MRSNPGPVLLSAETFFQLQNYSFQMLDKLFLQVSIQFCLPQATGLSSPLFPFLLLPPSLFPSLPLPSLPLPSPVLLSSPLHINISSSLCFGPTSHFPQMSVLQCTCSVQPYCFTVGIWERVMLCSALYLSGNYRLHNCFSHGWVRIRVRFDRMLRRPETFALASPSLPPPPIPRPPPLLLLSEPWGLSLWEFPTVWPWFFGACGVVYLGLCSLSFLWVDS